MKIGFVTWAMVNCMMKITLITVCVKTLAKNFHHLSIIWFLVSDVCLSTVSSIYSISQQMINKAMCVLLIHFIFYFLLLNYSFMLLVCIHRFVLLKTMTFNAVKQKFENYKYRIISGTVFIPFLYELGNTILMPKQESIHTCSALNMYGQHQSAFIAVTVVPITIFLFTVVSLYAISGHIVWRSFMRVRPVDENVIFQNITTRNESTGKTALRSEPFCTVRMSPNENVSDSNSLKLEDIVVTQKGETTSSLHCKKVISNDKRHCNNGSSFDQPNDDDIICIELDPSNHTNEEPIAKQDDLPCDRSNMSGLPRVGIMTGKSPIIRQPTVLNKGNTNRSWEMRAFFTCLLIAVQTVLLTGPFVFGLWMDVISGQPTSVQFKFILTFPYLLQGLINIFLYSWRFEEVRKGFRQFCRRQSN